MVLQTSGQMHAVPLCTIIFHVPRPLCFSVGAFVMANMFLEDFLYSLWRKGRMHQTVRVACPEIVKQLNDTTTCGDRVLRRAIDRGNLAFLRALLAIPGIPVNITDGRSYTPLIFAIRSGNADAVRLLLSSDAIDVNLSLSNDTPLCVAVRKSEHEILRMLLAAPGILVNGRDGDCHPLLEAALVGSATALRLLVRAPGLDVDCCNASGDFATHLAVKRRHLEFLKCLVRMPAVDVSVANADTGETALDVAVSHQYKDFVDVLLEHTRIPVLIGLRKKYPQLLDKIERSIVAQCARMFVREDVVKSIVLVSSGSYGEAKLRCDPKQRPEKRTRG